MRALSRWFFSLLLIACCAVVLLGMIEAAGGKRPVRSVTADGVTVVIDAGHGGFDGGAVGTDSGVKEDGLNLAVARLLEQELAGRGMDVKMTRTDERALGDDKQADMRARRETMADPSVDLVVSIHMNKFGDRSVAGAMAYYMQGSAEGEALAQAVIDAVTLAAGQKQRLANPGDYFVVRECAVPAVLVECGFLSNAAEEQKLQDPAYQALLAKAVADGVMAYLSSRSAA